MPEENFDYESEAVDQGVQDFDQGEELSDDGSGFDLMEQAVRQLLPDRAWRYG